MIDKIYDKKRKTIKLRMVKKFTSQGEIIIKQIMKFMYPRPLIPSILINAYVKGFIGKVLSYTNFPS